MSVLSEGDVVTTKAGKLPCKAVFHAIFPTQIGDLNDKTSLQKVVSACLDEADKQQYESLAIPALGVGRFPAKEATEYIVEAVDIYLKKHGEDTSLKRIFFCDKLVENVQEFNDTMMKIFGEDGVQGMRATGVFFKFIFKLSVICITSLCITFIIIMIQKFIYMHI